MSIPPEYVDELARKGFNFDVFANRPPNDESFSSFRSSGRQLGVGAGAPSGSTAPTPVFNDVVNDPEIVDAVEQLDQEDKDRFWQGVALGAGGASLLWWAMSRMQKKGVAIPPKMATAAQAMNTTPQQPAFSAQVIDGEIVQDQKRLEYQPKLNQVRSLGYQYKLPAPFPRKFRMRNQSYAPPSSSIELTDERLFKPEQKAKPLEPGTASERARMAMEAKRVEDKRKAGEALKRVRRARF